MGYLHSQRAFFRMGQDAVGKTEIEEFLNNINTSVQGVNQELQQETKKTVDLIDNLEQQSAHLYHAEPPVDMPYIPPNTTLSQKSGYLYVRSKQLLATKWDRCYFFIQAGNLMSQAKMELAGSLVLDLNEPGVRAEPYEADDRKFVFQISSPNTKKSVVVQAENDREKDEWICTINNVVRESGYTKGKPQQLAKPKERTSSTGSSTKQVSNTSSPDGQPNQSLASTTPVSSMTTPAANNNAFLPDVPIQFDLMSQKDIESGGVTSNLSGPPKRINPFDTSATEVLDTLDAAIDNATYVESYVVRFLGSMEVKSDRGEQLIHETMRQILAARAIHNVFKMTESRLVVSSECMRLVDPSNNGIRTQFALSDISFWAAHHENNRLFGFITRNKQPGATLSTFACHVFECNVSADEICQAIGTATKLAFQALMEKKAVEKIRKVKSQEKDILLSNIQQLDDAGEEDEALAGLPLSPDGKYLILTATDDADDVLQSPDITSTAVASAAVSQQPIQQTNNDDDEERVCSVKSE